ncbi:hypothetical protein BJ165DRAFT_424938 [Panaeolus papilionaceus]|nr:hypothetical protein BJ165DRAFT_424938 [Panaeolus papilionaceus]
MRKAYKAAEWALEAKKSKTLIWWNVWILLAMPAIWLAWSLVLYVTCILSFVWRTGDPGSGPPAPLSPGGLLAVRIVLTVILGLGGLYGSLIFITFRRYGDAMDRQWKARIDGWIREKANESHYRPYQPQSYPQHNSSPYYYPTFVSAPNEPNIRIPTTVPGGSWYTPSHGPPHSRSMSQLAASENDGWRSQAQKAHDAQVAGMRSSPITTTRDVNEGLKDYPPLRQPVMDDPKPRRDSADDEVPRYNYPEYQASLSTYGYTADAKAQYKYETGRNSNDVMPAPGLKEKMETVQAPLPRTQHDFTNPSHPGLNKTIGSASSSTTTAPQAPPYSSPSTSPTPPSYSSIPAYVTTHNLNNNPLRFNPPLKKNPQISMPPPPSLPTIPGTPLTIVTMRSFDSTAGAENYPMRGSPANDSMT